MSQKIITATQNQRKKLKSRNPLKLNLGGKLDLRFSKLRYPSKDGKLNDEVVAEGQYRLTEQRELGMT